MALPPNGTISMDAIRAELGVPTQAPFNINDARLGTYAPLNPYSPTLPPQSFGATVSLSDWYSYCHTCTTLYSHTVYVLDDLEGFEAWTSSSAACSGTRSFPVTVYSSSSTLSIGSTLYHLVGTRYSPFVTYNSGSELWVYENTGGRPIRMTSTSSNVIAAVGTCDPATATLTIYYESNKWWGELSAAIPSAGISIAAGVVRGYYDACLGAADETVDMWSDSGKVVQNGFSIPAGFTINTGYTPFEQFSGSVINYNMINNVEINGVARTDGSTFTVGGTTVTLSLPLSCTSYS